VANYGADATFMAQLAALRGTGDSWLIGFLDACEEVSIFHLNKSH
jgi:hypothetical protein